MSIATLALRDLYYSLQLYSFIVGAFVDTKHVFFRYFSKFLDVSNEYYFRLITFAELIKIQIFLELILVCK